MPGRQLDVDVEARPRAFAQLVRGAGLWVRVAPCTVAHVERHGQDVVAVVEALLRPVAVVDVPVQDRDAVDAAAARVLGCEGDVVEEAVAVRLRRLGVVARRAHERVGGLSLA